MAHRKVDEKIGTPDPEHEPTPGLADHVKGSLSHLRFWVGLELAQEPHRIEHWLGR